MRYAAFSILALAIAAAPILAQDHTKDTTDDVKKALKDKKAVLLDVRERKEWDEGHLKDAALLPLTKLNKGATKEELDKLIPKGSIVYLHCKAGGRCLTAAEVLKKHGYDARPLKDGYESLLKAGFPKADK